MLWEFYKLGRRMRASAQKYYGSIIGAALFLITFFSQYLKSGQQLVLIIIPMFIMTFVFELYRVKKAPFLNIGITLLGLIYISVPFALMNYLVFYGNHHQFNGHLLLGVLILTWIYDSGAYLVGVSIGKNRLFERISPKKSWEGFIGGVVITLGLAPLVARFLPILSLTDWLIIAAIVVTFSTLGDLTESLFKRSINVKDSGHFMPGHGGILDRFDSLLFSIPIIFTYLYFFV